MLCSASTTRYEVRAVWRAELGNDELQVVFHFNPRQIALHSTETPPASKLRLVGSVVVTGQIMLLLHTRILTSVYLHRQHNVRTYAFTITATSST